MEKTLHINLPKNSKLMALSFNKRRLHFYDKICQTNFIKLLQLKSETIIRLMKYSYQFIPIT